MKFSLPNFLIPALCLLTFSLVTSNAQFGQQQLGSDQLGATEEVITSTSKLLIDSAVIKPGQTFTAAVEISHPPHFHSYYKNDGIGISIIPEVKWTLPEGFKASELIYPAPKQFTFVGMNAYGYEGTNYFLTEITAPLTLDLDKEITLKAKVDWQVCDDKSCMPPESKSFSKSIPVAKESIENPDYQKELSIYLNEKIPTKTIPESWQLKAKEENGKITLEVSFPLTTDTKFFEYDAQIDAQKDRSTELSDSKTTFIGVRNQGNDFAPDPPEVKDRLRGIIYIPTKLDGVQNQAFWVDVPLNENSSVTPTAATVETSTALTVTDKPAGIVGVLLNFTLLFLGGLILNLMPCVFPVIGLKIMSFVNQAGQDTKKIKLHGFVFTAGVLLSFLALALVLFPIKATTTLGSQLQDPIVVFILLIIMLLLALSMAGVFEIGTKATGIGGNLQSKDGIAGSFFSGVLAVIVATPCSAPFLGPAIGVAWQYDQFLFTLALLTMGLGLALPYVILSFFPKLVNKLPRPGAWMESFKQGMSFLLFAVVGFLIWVYSGHVGDEGQKELFVLLGLTVISLAAWVYGRWNLPSKKRKTRNIALALSLVFLVTGITMAMPEINKDDAEDSQSGVAEIEWRTWSPEAVQQALDEGNPVYVDFTARWCVVCQTNKNIAYTEEVRQAFFDKNIVAFKADMTKPHKEATEAVHKLGRSAIPVNVFYNPGENKPHITIEVLTPSYLKTFIDDHVK